MWQVLVVRDTGDAHRTISAALAVAESGDIIKANVNVHHQECLGGVPREQKMLEGHLIRVIYHQVC